jgi:hypothetical protein
LCEREESASGNNERREEEREMSWETRKKRGQTDFLLIKVGEGNVGPVVGVPNVVNAEIEGEERLLRVPLRFGGMEGRDLVYKNRGRRLIS